MLQLNESALVRESDGMQQLELAVCCYIWPLLHAAGAALLLTTSFAPLLTALCSSHNPYLVSFVLVC
jgi:hypothetical protein